MTAVKLATRHFALVRDRFIAKSEELTRLLRKRVHADIDPLVALRNVFDAEHAYIVDGYLVVYDITEMWWSDATVISEQLIFALEPESSISAVLEFLEAKGREAGAQRVCVGTALAKSDKALAHVYEKLGFEQIAIHLGKEIT